MYIRTKNIGFRLLFLTGIWMWAVPHQVYTQSREVLPRNQFWIGYIQQARLSKNWGFWFDVHLRTLQHPTLRQLQMVRPGLTYYLKDHLRVMVGYCHVITSLENNDFVYSDEYRPWQQIWYRQKMIGYLITQWLRLEQRWQQRVIKNELQSEYDFSNRLRYNFYLAVPLNSKELTKNTLFLAIHNEIMINFGRNIVYNTFDQNRFFAGLGFGLTEHMQITFGYLHVYQQRANGYQYFDVQALRLFIFHNLDMRYKQEVPPPAQ